MENFIVSARKYRPQTFDSVVGQEHITTTLKNAIRNHQLAHAFLFCGPRGVGKTTCARILAKTINCGNITPEGEACNECPSCISFNEGTSFNIHELDAASNNSVDDIRTLTEQVRFAPQAGRYKIYIIDEVHMLSASAFNAFLKTLEEPPPYAIFILATTEKHKILPTILSRCQIFDFRRITIQDTVKHLAGICKKEKIEGETDALHIIAQKSEGCMRDALSILDKIVSFTNGRLTYANTLEHLNILDYDYFFRVTEAVLDQDAAGSLLILDEILQKGFEGDNFLNGFAEFIRNLLICKDERVTHLLEVPDNLKKQYHKTAARAGDGLLISTLHLLNNAAIQYKTAGNKRLQVEMTLIRLSYLQQAVELIGDGYTGEVAKKKVTEPANVQRLRGPFMGPLAEKIKKKASPARGEASPAPAEVAPAPAEGKPAEDAPAKTAAASPAGTEKVAPPPETAPASPAVSPAPASVAAAAPPAGARRAVAEPALPASNKLSDLKTLRKKLSKQQADSASTEVSALPVTEEALGLHWQVYIDQMRAAQKIQLAAHLEMAQPQPVSEAEISVICRNELQRHFIEDEKMELADHFKAAFHNPALILTLQVDSNMEPATEQSPILSAREQYQRLIEKYPLIRELKDKLNLELDY